MERRILPGSTHTQISRLSPPTSWIWPTPVIAHHMTAGLSVPDHLLFGQVIYL
jgi:energy-converting hydrogenase Eha subunit A